VGEGGVERRRRAWVTAGWKGPPKGECLRRWQGRTWPCVKKVEKILLRWVRELDGRRDEGRRDEGRGGYLFAKQMSAAPRVQRRLEGSKA
jgi:hypothetical protein